MGWQRKARIRWRHDGIKLGFLSAFAFLLAATPSLAGPVCSPLYRVPAVQQVINEHVERVFRTRRRDPSIPYDVVRNVELLTERIATALRRDYVENPAYPGTLIEKRAEATEAALAVGLNVLVSCFADYRKLYVAFVERSARVSSVAPSKQSEDSVAGCPEPLATQRGRDIVDRFTRETTERIETGQEKDGLDQQTLNTLGNRLWLGLAAISLGEPAYSRLREFTSGLNVETVRKCMPSYVSAVEAAQARRRDQEIEEKKSAELKAAAESEAKAKIESQRAKSLERFEKEASEPRRVLQNAYHAYITVLTCYEARKDLLHQFITENLLADDRRAMKEIETAAKATAPTLETDLLWAETVADFGDQRFFIYFNKDMIAALQGQVMGVMFELARQQHQALYDGKTGAERLVNFKRLVRNAEGDLYDAVRAQCLDADAQIKKRLVRMRPGASAPKKDF